MAKSSKKGGGGGSGGGKKKKHPVAAPPDGVSNNKQSKKGNRHGKKTKKRSGSAGGGGNKSANNSKRSRNPVSALGPFNVRPLSRKQQSRQDQKKAGTYGRIKGRGKFSQYRGSSNRNDAHTPHRAFPHGQRAPKYKVGRQAEHNFAPRRGGRHICLLYTSPSPRDAHESRMPSSA